MRVSLVTYPFALLRSPLLPIDALDTLLHSVTDDTALWNWLNQRVVEESLWVASPDLYQLWLRWKRQPKILPRAETRLSLWRYVVRMSSRSTPFGLFAGVSLVRTDLQTWGDVDRDVPIPIIRPDFGWLSELIHQLELNPQLRLALRYQVNNSLYQLGEQLRYSDYKLQSGKRAFYLNAVVADQTISDLLKSIQTQQEGLSGHDLLTFLTVHRGEEQADAHALVDELIDAHLLTSELEPMITGKDAFGQLIDRLRKLPEASSWVSKLTAIQKQLQSGSLSSIVEDNTEQQMRTLIGEEYAEKVVCQVDLVRPAETVQIKKEVVEQIGRELLELAPLRSDTKSPVLHSFARRFYARYGEQVIPLLQALDHETGIGYGDVPARAGQLSLLGELGEPATIDRPLADRLDKLRLAKLTAFLETGQAIQELAKADLDSVSVTAPNTPLARSWAVLGELYGDDAKTIDDLHYQFLVRSVAGPTGAALMARFGSSDEVLTNYLRQLTDWEDGQYTDALLAEIVHLPADRVGNVLSRPVLRNYEIPYVTPSSVDWMHTVRLDDLWVRVVDGTTVELWSKSRNKRVIPRNTTAHNYHQSDDVYRFLTDLSHQDEGFSLRWLWGGLVDQPRLPRLVYKHLIVARAQWTLQWQTHWASATDMVVDLQQRLSLPQRVALVEGDHELLLDLSSLPGQQILFAQLDKRNTVRVVEWLSSSDRCWVRRAGQRFASELVIPFGINQTPLPSRCSPFSTGMYPVRRSFGPGSEWLYVKVYTGELTANEILTQVVRPLVTKATEEGWIDHWFFIRYYDPESHLRLRFHSSEQTYYLVLAELNRLLEPWIDKGLVQPILVDTYVRELERYGPATMSVVERLFWRESEWMLSWIEQEIAFDDDLHWYVACERADYLLKAFRLSTIEKRNLMQRLQARFLAENEMNAALRKELNTQYRGWQGRISHSTLPQFSWPDIEASARQIEQVRQTHSIEAPTLSDLLGSLLHVQLNRFFTSAQRMSEGVVYHFLLRQYLTGLATASSCEVEVC